MPATTYVARTETGTVTRSSSTRTYAYAVLVKNTISGERFTATDENGEKVFVADTAPEGAWGWSGDRANAEKAANQARRVYRSVRVVPVLTIAKTSAEFRGDAKDMSWHATDLDGNVVAYSWTKSDLVEKLGRTRRAADSRI